MSPQSALKYSLLSLFYLFSFILTHITKELRHNIWTHIYERRRRRRKSRMRYDGNVQSVGVKRQIEIMTIDGVVCHMLDSLCTSKRIAIDNFKFFKILKVASLHYGLPQKFVIHYINQLQACKSLTTTLTSLKFSQSPIKICAL